MDIFLATGKELVVNVLLKEQSIEDIIEPNTFNTGQQDTEQGLYRPILYKMTAKVVTESIRKMINMSVLSVITIMLLKVVFIFTSRVNMKELDMNVINVNTKQYARVILLNINRQISKELNMNATSVNTNLHESYKIKA